VCAQQRADAELQLEEQKCITETIMEEKALVSLMTGTHGMRLLIASPAGSPLLCPSLCCGPLHDS